MSDIFTPQLALDQVLGVNAAPFLETRMENNDSGQPIYIGWTPIANSPTSSANFMIKKVSYDDNNAVNYYQLPNKGLGFIYIWDDRDSYF